MFAGGGSPLYREAVAPHLDTGHRHEEDPMNIQTITLLIAAVSALLTAGIAILVLRLRVDAASPNRSGDITSRLDKMVVAIASDRGALTEKMTQVDTKIASLQTTVDQREGALQSQVTQLDASMRGIVGLFSNDRQRGSWGELSLKRIFELAGMVEHRDYELQFTKDDKRPDAVVFIPGNQSIVIDSKFPIARFQDALGVEDETERTRLLVQHGKELEQTGKALAKKHYAAEATAGYVIMYLPSQAVFEAAASAQPDVIERLLEKRIIVAGPLNVFALIKTAGSLMAQGQAIEEANEIIAEVRILRDRLNTFAGYLTDVGVSINKAATAFNKAIGSWNSRLRPSVNRMADMSRIDSIDSIEEVEEHISTTTPQELKEAS